MNTISVAYKESPQKGSEVRKNGQNFEPKRFGLPSYFRDVAPLTPIKCGSNCPAYEMRKKGKRKGRKEREKDRKMRDEIAKKKTHLHAHTFSHRDPCAMTFREYKKLAVNNISTFVFK